MLDLLRKNSRSFIIYLMFAIIIVVFAFTFGAVGPSQACGGSTGPGGYAVADFANVDGVKIDTGLLNLADSLSLSPPGPRSTSPQASDLRRDYLLTRFAILRLYGPFAGARFGRDTEDVSMIKPVKLMDELVETHVVAGYARSLGMTVTNAEMNDRLALLLQQFVDEKTGKFDVDGWANYLRRVNTTPSAFEAFVKNEILRERVIALMVGGVEVTDAELAAQRKLTGEMVKIEYVAVDPGAVAPLVKVTDDEIAAWLKDHQEEADKEYEAKKDSKFTTPKQWTLRAIKLDAPDPSVAEGEQKTALEAERAAIKARAEALQAEVKAAVEAAVAVPAPGDGDEPAATPAEVFGTFAAANSTDASKDAAGAIGTKGLKDLVRRPYGAEVQKAVEGLAPEQVSAAVEVTSGFWILYADAVTEPVVKTIEEARVTLATEAVRAEKAPELVKTIAAEVLAESKKDPLAKLEVAAATVSAKYGITEGKGFQAKEASPFARLQPIADGFPDQLPFIAGLGRSAALVRAAFAATAEAPLLDQTFAMEPSESTILIARWLEKLPPEPLEGDAKQQLVDQLTFEKQRRIYRSWYEGYLASKQAEGDVQFTKAWTEERRRQEEAYRSAGGVLPDDKESPKPATADAKPADDVPQN
ncbi:MAG: hypothetical protein CVU56_02205 [Deltaproteobacteria bacterium HGW-Deltaproteobacteria-14]|jgi:hypothetical protein|nr:MAG: hypothetical protein CVU56_02205 [Deltaproteobacteria bacterium HGW-Deltaproteobacteria-14]